MCGFVGGTGETRGVSPKDIWNSIHHRGPDSRGFQQLDGTFLAHTRLSIMDSSIDSAQPMNFENLTLLFNGAIYNYPEIKSELESKGYSFFSENGDSEVILKGFHFWGKEVIKKLNGIFSIAIYNRKDGSIFFARDRFGIKPLYYSLKNRDILFGSTLQSLLPFEVDRELDPVAVHNYFSFHSVVLPPNTIFKGVKKFPQAHYGFFRDGKLEIEKYWKLEITESEKSFAELKAELSYNLEESIKRQLLADTDVGVLLSGGVDSSLLTAIAKKYKPDLQTFSIGFDGVGDELGDEFYYSDIVKNHFKTNHHKIVIDSNRTLRNLKGAIKSMSEPMISHDSIGFYLLSQEVSRTIKVVQSGQGADEVFGGYHWYPKIANESGDFGDIYQRYFFDKTHSQLKDIVRPDLIGDRDYSLEAVRDYYQSSGASRPIDGSLHIDTNLFLVDDPVKRVDNMTMAWGLEGRVPFLDHKLVEFAFSIPAKYRYGNGGKHILKEVARDWLPNEVIDREKGYFPVPALKYIKGEFLEFVRDHLDSRVARERGIINRKEVDKMLKSPNSYLTNLRTNFLWQTALLEIWLQENGI